jgi:hypothetical protein
LAAVCPPLTAHLQQLRTQLLQQQQPDQQQQQQLAWQHQPQECDAVAKLAVFVLTAWHQIFKVGWRMQPKLDVQSCKQQLLQCAALAAALLQTRPAVKWSLDDEDDDSSSSSDTHKTTDQQQQQQAARWEQRGLRPATGNSLWFDTEARLIRHLDGAAYAVGDLLRIVLALLTAPAAAAAGGGVDKWSSCCWTVQMCSCCCKPAWQVT